jgi:glycosyltransferase involved in cell wall biosynthesis
MTTNKTLKILHLRSSNFYGGPERQIHFHAKLAQQTGVDMCVASFSEENTAPELLNRVAADNIQTELFSVKNAYDSNAIKLIRKYIADNQIDILCTHEYRSHYYGFRACNGSATKWVAFSRGMTTENLKIRIFTFLEKYLIRKASHIVAVSDSQKRKLINQSLKPENITAVHNAIDLSFIDSIPAVSIKEKFHFEQGHYICISAGRFSEEKGQLYLVKAAEVALKQNDKLRFVLFGDGPDLVKIQEYIKQKNLQTYILCPGFEADVLPLIKTADLLVNPSLSEGLPNIVLEALASETPVVLTNVGGHPEIVTDNRNGYIVEPENIDQLAEKILLCVSDRSKQAEFIRESKKVLRDKFSFESQNDKLRRIYEKQA